MQTAKSWCKLKTKGLEFRFCQKSAENFQNFEIGSEFENEISLSHSNTTKIANLPKRQSSVKFSRVNFRVKIHWKTKLQ